MVFISKRIRFLMAERRRAAMEAFQFNTFADEGGAVVNQRVEQMPEFVNELDTPPQTAEITELAPAQCREAEMQHPRPVRRVTLEAALYQMEEMANQPGTPVLQHMRPVGEVAIQDALTSFEGTVQATTSHSVSHISDLFVATMNPSIMTAEDLLHVEFHEDDVALFMSIVNNFPPSDDLAYLSPGSPEHFPDPEHHRGLPPQPSLILGNTSTEVSPAAYNPMSVTAPQVTEGEQVDLMPKEENLWHGFNLTDSSMGGPDCNSIAQWSAMNWFSSGLNMPETGITDETLRPVTLPDYVQDDSNSESSSRNSFFEGPWPVLSQLPSQDISMNDAQTVPNQPVNPEDGLINAAAQDGGFDSGTFPWLPMTGDTPGLSFDI